jgi:hypothetical protein
VARLAARTSARAGHEMTFAVDMEQAHFFEPGEFGRNLMAS